MSLTLPEATIEALQQAHETLNAVVWRSGASPAAKSETEISLHGLLDETVQAAHLIAIATAGQRIVTIEEIATHLGIDARTVRRRIREADPLILPVKTIASLKLFTLEDIPRIAAAHANNVFERGANVLYATADIRKAVAKAARKDTQARVQRDPNVRWADWGVKRRNRVPEKVTVELHQHIAADLRTAIAQDGEWQDLGHMLRGVALVWLEQRKERLA